MTEPNLEDAWFPSRKHPANGRPRTKLLAPARDIPIPPRPLIGRTGELHAHLSGDPCRLRGKQALVPARRLFSSGPGSSPRLRFGNATSRQGARLDGSQHVMDGTASHLPDYWVDRQTIVCPRIGTSRLPCFVLFTVLFLSAILLFQVCHKLSQCCPSSWSVVAAFFFWSYRMHKHVRTTINNPSWSATLTITIPLPHWPDHSTPPGRRGARR
jgi:hypothetical protein